MPFAASGCTELGCLPTAHLLHRAGEYCPRGYKATLNAIYNRYAYANQSIHDIMRDDGMLSIGEWLTLIDHLGLTASGQISPHQAKMIFMWSRLRRYTNEHSNTIVTLANGWHAAAERAAIDKAGGSGGATAAAASSSKNSKCPDLTAIDKSGATYAICRGTTKRRLSAWRRWLRCQQTKR